MFFQLTESNSGEEEDELGEKRKLRGEEFNGNKFSHFFFGSKMLMRFD